MASWTTSRGRQLMVIAGCTVTAFVLLLAAAQGSSAQGTRALAAQLAADTEQLVDARAELDDLRADQRAVRREHRSLGALIEVRVVQVYKTGGALRPLTHIASGGSMDEVGSSIDTLDQVARHEALEVRRWQKLGARLQTLTQRGAALEVRVRAETKAVARGRAKLLRAERAAEAARREAEEMARIVDSPLIPKVGNPESTTSQEGSDDIGKTAAAPPRPTGMVQSGTASMYADSFTGEVTANGEHYDPNAYTAAHPSLPFGTWVTVSAPGGSVAVRINDRGPYVGGRIIDLSRAAAAAISLPGIGPVTLSVGG